LKKKHMKLNSQKNIILKDKTKKIKKLY